MDPIGFKFNSEPDEPEPQQPLNRHERRARLAMYQKERKKLIKRLNARAEKTFERIKATAESTKQEMTAGANPDVAQQYGFE